MNREYHRWHSPALGRDMELLVFGHAGARTLVFPTRLGRFYDYENWGLVARLRPAVEAGLLQLFCLDSLDAESLYAGWRHPRERIVRHRQYEAYVVEEVVPFTRHSNDCPTLIAHGCSLGAYHALNLALRRPDTVHKVVAVSGRYDLTLNLGPYRDLFDGYYDEDVYFHTPCHYVPNLSDPAVLERLRRLEIVIAVGRDDAVYENNRWLSDRLWEKGVRHAFAVWDGERHRASCWRSMVPHYL